MLTEALVGGALGRRNAGAESLGWAEAEKPAGEKQLSVQSSRNRERKLKLWGPRAESLKTMAEDGGWFLPVLLKRLLEGLQ